MECLCRKCAERARPRETLLSRQSLRTLFVRSRYALFIEMVRSLCQRRRCSRSFMFVHVYVHVPQRSSGDLLLNERREACVKTSLLRSASFCSRAQEASNRSRNIFQVKFSRLVFRSIGDSPVNDTSASVGRLTNGHRREWISITGSKVGRRLNHFAVVIGPDEFAPVGRRAASGTAITHWRTDTGGIT